MIALKIEVSVGYCGSCHRFRNNMEWKVGEKVVCLDCFQSFKNQRLIDEIKKAPREEKPVIEKVKVKVKRNRVKPEVPVPLPLNSVPRRKMLLKVIKEAPSWVTTNDLFGRKGLGSRGTVNTNLKNLLNNNLIVSMKTGRWIHYIDVDRKDLLKKAVIPTYSSREIEKRRQAVLKFIQENKELTAVSSMVAELKMRKPSVIKHVKHLQKKGLVVYAKTYGSDHKFLIAPTNNQELVEKVNEVANGSLTAKVMEVLQKADKPITISSILKTMGRSNGGTRTYKLIRKLLRDMKCDIFKKGHGVYYRLKKNG